MTSGLSVSGHAALVLWAQLAALLIVARGLGAVVRRIGQPPIVGALLAGLLLGPSVFGQLWPAGFAWFLPTGGMQGQLLGTVASTSLLLLLIVLGAETDLPLIRSLGRASVWVTGLSFLAPFGAGLVASYLLPAALLGSSGHRLPFALLLAGAIGISSLPVVASIIRELGMVRRNFGQLAVAAATVHDVIGFLLLALAGALAGEGGGGGVGKLAIPLVGLLVLVAVLAWAGQPLVDVLLRRVRRAGPNVAGSLTVSIGCGLSLAAVTQGLGLDGALGAFLAGVVLGRSRFQQGQALRHLETFTAAVFAPLYFATAGLQVDLTTLGSGSLLLSLAAVLVIAVVAKYGGAWLGARIGGLPAAERRALGVALNGRGALQVILGTAGLSLGVFSGAAYTIVILVAIVTSLAVPPLLRRSVRDWAGEAGERQRLDDEEQLAANVVVRGQRLLLPSRGTDNSLAAARLLNAAWPAGSEVTVLPLPDEHGADPDLSVITAAFRDRSVRTRQPRSDDLLEEILAEANLGYGVIALGAVESPTPQRLLPEVIEGLLARCPIPLLIVRRGHEERSQLAGGNGAKGDGGISSGYRRIVVPVTGTAASRAGQEVAHNIALHTDSPLTVLHALTRPDSPPAHRPATSAPDASTATGAADAILGDARQVATAQRVQPDMVLRQGLSAGEEIEAAAREMDADLIVLGATVRRVGDRPFLGYTVEHLLDHAAGPTIVAVVLPDTTSAATATDGHTDRTAR